MDIFNYMEKYDFEQLTFFHHKETGLKAITCIHNTVLGTSLGGTRFYNYENEDQAIEDVLRLARGMTYKNSLAGLPLGGGKSVIMGDVSILNKDPVKREAFWRAFGRYVEGLGGRYITAQDMNTTLPDLVNVSKETEFVAGLPGGSGSPSPYTARGVYNAMRACFKHLYGSDSPNGKTVAVQGIGSVGYSLCEYLHKDGAKLIVADTNAETLEKAKKELGATVVSLDEIYGVECDVFAPTAIGAIINDDTIPQLKCKIVCGGANNVLKDADVHAPALQAKGILYAPDYLANAGGVISVAHEVIGVRGFDKEAATRDVDAIYDTMLAVLAKSQESGKLTYQVADEMAEARIEAIIRTKRIQVGPSL